jgi:hypothetical protein
MEINMDVGVILLGLFLFTLVFFGLADYFGTKKDKDVAELIDKLRRDG